MKLTVDRWTGRSLERANQPQADHGKPDHHAYNALDVVNVLFHGISSGLEK